MTNQTEREACILAGCGHAEKKEYDEAVACFQRAVELDRGAPDAYYYLGSAFSRTGRLNEALACLQRAVAIDAGEAAYRRTLGDLYFRKGELREAIAAYHEALRIEPGRKDVLNNLGIALLRMGIVEEGKRLVFLAQSSGTEVPCVPTFRNEAFERLDVNHANFFQRTAPAGDESEPLRMVRRIAFGLSDICNYAGIHKKCPLHLRKNKTVLPERVILRTMDELADVGFDGVMKFSVYNEPLIDPRLFRLIAYAKKRLDGVRIDILSNGFYLTQELADELADLGVWVLEVSAYSPAEFERLRGLDVRIPYHVAQVELDDRLKVYDSPVLSLKVPCQSPIRDLIVNEKGDVQLCCFDWKAMHTFGNIGDRKLGDILKGKDILAVHRGLAQGEKALHLCQRCWWELYTD